MIFTLIGTAIAGALFGGSLLAATLIAGALAFGAKLAISYLTRPKKRKYSAVQGETQFGGDVPVSTLFGIGKVRGQRLFYAKYGSGNKFNAEVFALANGWCDGLEPYIYCYGEKHALVSRSIIGNEAAHYGVNGFGDLISIRFYDGRPGQGVDTNLVANSASLGQTWKSTSVCAGLTYVVVEREYDSDKFSKGKPEFDFALRGLREYDPRKDSTVAGGSGPQRLGNLSTYVFTKNPAVHRLNYQLGLKGLISGRTLTGEGKSLGQLDLGTYFAAMNVCDTIRKGKPTYQCALFVSSDDDHTEVLKEFDDAMAGYGLNRRGLSGIIPGAPQIPVMEITADDIPIDRSQDVQRRKSAFDLFNHLSGQFTSEASQWAPESLTPIYVNTDVLADGRARQTSNDFLQVTDADIAQYLLTIRYRQNRMGGSATVPVSRRVGLAVQEGEWVTFDGSEWLITGWQCDEQFRFTLVLAETSADIYDDGDIAPGPIIIPSTPPLNPSLLSTVQSFAVEAGMITGADGYENPVLRFTWTPPEDPTITAVRFEYGVEGETVLFNDQMFAPEDGGYITDKNVMSGKIYLARATIVTVPDRFKSWTPWATTSTATGFMAVTAYLKNVGKDVYQTIQELRADHDNLRERMEMIAAVSADATGADISLHTVAKKFQNATAVAMREMTAKIEENADGLVAQAEILDAVSVQVGNISADGLRKIEVTAGTGDVVARLTDMVRASIADVWVEAGTVVEVGFTDGDPTKPYSNYILMGQKILFMNADGDVFALFGGDGLTIQNVRLGTLFYDGLKSNNGKMVQRGDGDNASLEWFD